MNKFAAFGVFRNCLSPTALISSPVVFNKELFEGLVVVRLDWKLSMATFAGTSQKCTACEKTVYLVDKLTADSRSYHKACFRCHHCRGTLKLSNFCSFEGVLYCRPHYDQLFKRTGSLDKSFEGTPKILKPEKPTIENENSKAVSNMFVGTKDKCVGCEKTVYPIEKVSVNGTSYHRRCFKCTHGGCTISPSNYIAHEGKLYCKHHHIQLFKEKGNYSQLENEREKQSETGS
ncbi:LIM domain-containing protein WLIM1-like isoform X2 [Rosa rugosa]|uniref:LIM domain-containing protein WLIM1-like isoform X2 n=1 Tax=Rosa rugosa TaxID=74645 RepID=UPI002B400494|nr:LIM domain-containing protein WLIM1-like isoform X2 [Rosa rugosa]